MRDDRSTGETWLTLAGLLMFGSFVSIQEILPNFMLDYQERPEAKTERRWIDRLTLDGKWSGNLYDFYRRVYLKLTADLKVPFQLDAGERKEETIVHIALREALANAIAHADYSDRASVLVVKRPDMFGFRNPGLMRVPLEIAKQGGEHDCRNRTIHKMLRMVGLGEQAGTGIPKIFQGWESQHWNPPNLTEKLKPNNQTILELRMVDLFPSAEMDKLRSKLGSDFDSLSADERAAVALASIEGTVSHARLCSVSSNHPVEVSRSLQHLVQLGYLVSTGGGRGAVYHLPDREMPSADDVFGPPDPSFESDMLREIGRSNQSSSSSGIKPSSSDLVDRSSVMSERKPAKESNRDNQGYLLVEQLPLPLLDNLQVLSTGLKQRLLEMANEPRTKGKLDRDVMREVLKAVCSGHYVTVQCIAELVSRQPNSLRNEYLSPMVHDRTLSLAFPKTPTHEKQAYCTTASIPNEAFDNLTPWPPPTAAPPETT